MSAATLVVTNTADAGIGSLRQAILTANQLPGANYIHFNIPGPGPHLITPLTEYPAITEAVTIDGTTQPGFAGTPLIVLDGDQATAVQNGFIAGFRILGGNTTVRGITLYSWGSGLFWGAGISMTGPGNNVIEGNHIGLDPFGFPYAGNSIAIYCVGSSHNRIGGADPTNRNVISHNYYGLLITNSPLTVSSNNLVQGNFFGTDPTGTSARANIADAILISGGQMNRIVQNTIAFNHTHGVRLTNANNGNTISQNLIYGNVRLGINLQATGEPNFSVTPNDDGDSDAGPNGLQNFPVISAVRGTGDSTVITGDLLTRPNRTYRIEFYRSTRADPSGFGQGEFYLGSTFVTTDGTGSASFEFTAPGNFPDHYYTATGTDQESGDTSEFSQAIGELQMSIAISKSDVQLSFPSVAGRTYSLEATRQLSDPKGWQPLSGAENLRGTGEVLTVHDSLNPQASYRCYRVRVLQ